MRHNYIQKFNIPAYESFSGSAGVRMSMAQWVIPVNIFDQISTLIHTTTQYHICHTAVAQSPLNVMSLV